MSGPLIPCGFFLQDTGQLYLQEALDCETTSSYTLTVTANNSLSSCPLSASVDVVISVNDINDNRPAFSQDVYNATVNESIAISSPLLDVVATDDDKNVSWSVSYRIKLWQCPILVPCSLPTMTCCTVSS